MQLTQKLTKQLAVIGSMLVLGTSLVACAGETTSSAGVPQLSQLVMVPEVVNVGASETFQLAVYGRTAAGDSVTPAGSAVEWSTSNANVASVSAQGMITGGAAGTVTITAISGGATAAGQVTVTGATSDAHAGWHVAASGSSSGSGSAGSPWSLSFALSGAAGRVQPGDTVWLHGGTYRGSFVATVAGAAGRPVVIRQYPGQRATIDVAGSTSTTFRGDAFVVKGAWTEWWDFEMTDSDPNRYTNTRANMMINSASNTKYINLVVHDGGIGFYNYPSMSNVEFNGNIIYNNGWQGPEKGGGHALYLKSATGPVLVQDNISFNQFGYGIHLYTDAGAGALVNMTLDGNVAFNNGSISTQYATTPIGNILVGGEEPTKSSKVLNNMAYLSPGYGVYNVMIGYSDFANVDVTMSNNYAVGGTYVLTFGQWDRVTATGNTVIGSSRIVRMKDSTLAGYTWSQNDYQRDPTASAWTYKGTDYSFASWKLNTGLGVTDIVSSAQPTTPQVFVRPSKYEPGRAMIVVYNWGNAGSVNVDLGGVLPAGSNYEVRNVQNWYGAPVTTGTFGGGSISVPMGGVAPPPVVGGAPHTAPRTGPDFDVFVVRLVK